MKRFLFNLHSWMGLIAALGLIVIGLTGSILVFNEEIDRNISPAEVIVSPTPAGRLSYDTLLSGVRKAVPGYVVTGWSVADSPTKADQFYVVKEGTSEWRFVRVDPYTGEVRGTPTESSKTLTGWLLELHYTLFADHAGLIIAGLFATLLFFLGITGVWLYRGFWKTLFLLRWGRSARIFFSDTHKMVGITSVVFNLILGFTGAWWNFSHILHHMMEEEHVEEDPPIHRTFEAPGTSITALMAKAEAKATGYVPGYISLPTTEKDDLVSYGKLESYGPFRSNYGCVATFDAKSGELKDFTDVSQSGAWDQVLDSFTPLHYGTFGGLPVKILWSLGGLAPGILSITGFLMWYKRKFPKRRKQTASEPVGAREKGELEPAN
ncbi:PepSY-associated TM helix domain-containing protein [Verrucomicrobium sp. BvORR106]|uniref:PepSY-associated TM helix domain-containing protein n=1 Tax=Verrucomicrobium sp. BvORR106 TaxID=1403819 RepID=UPI00056FEF65|nr:PepSY-associated TM helix domain-containing protein [Verrucomicrobium sp. BvORR106]